MEKRRCACVHTTTSMSRRVIFAGVAGVGLGVALALRRARLAHARAAAALAGDGGDEAYRPPKWCPSYATPPARRLRLAHLPTPLHRWAVPRVHRTEVWIKRDDCTGCELSGNKIRKLEFLLADALASGADCVITVGGIQSNHCRATAAAARRVGLEPHIILRTAGSPDADPGLRGNLMIDRMVGARMHIVSEDEFSAKGGWGLVCELRDRLTGEGRRPYCFPSGGSNDVGAWGYVESIAELQRQADGAGVHFDRIYCAYTGFQTAPLTSHALCVTCLAFARSWVRQRRDGGRPRSRSGVVGPRCGRHGARWPRSR